MSQNGQAHFKNLAANGLIRKLKLISKFIASQTGQRNYNTHISQYSTKRNEGNQATKFGQLIEYNTRNIFLEKSYTKFGGEATSN